MDVTGISSEVRQLLREHDWPGNVRELEHTIEGAMNLILDEDTITIGNLPPKFRKKYQQEPDTLPDSLLNLRDAGAENRSLKEKWQKQKNFIFSRHLLGTITTFPILQKILASADKVYSTGCVGLDYSRMRADRTVVPKVARGVVQTRAKSRNSRGTAQIRAKIKNSRGTHSTPAGIRHSFASHKSL